MSAIDIWLSLNNSHKYDPELPQERKKEQNVDAGFDQWKIWTGTFDVKRETDALWWKSEESQQLGNGQTKTMVKLQEQFKRVWEQTMNLDKIVEVTGQLVTKQYK